MKFSTKEDLEVPIEACFHMLSDFEVFERAALRRGAEVVRTDALGKAGVGATWTARANYRGRSREINLSVTEFDRPNVIKVASKTGGLEAMFVVELMPLSRNRTRMRVELDVKPKTLSARLLMQSAKLARNRLNRRYKTRLSHFSADLEDRYQRQGSARSAQDRGNAAG